MVQLINDNQVPSDGESLEDCEVRDDDEEFGSFVASNSNRFAKGPLTAIVDEGSSYAGDQKREDENSNNLWMITPNSSTQKRRSSGRMIQKLVTNETIKPLPTSFAL